MHEVPRSCSSTLGAPEQSHLCANKGSQQQGVGLACASLSPRTLGLAAGTWPGGGFAFHGWVAKRDPGCVLLSLGKGTRDFGKHWLPAATPEHRRVFNATRLI